MKRQLWYEIVGTEQLNLKHARCDLVPDVLHSWETTAKTPKGTLHRLIVGVPLYARAQINTVMVTEQAKHGGFCTVLMVLTGSAGECSSRLAAESRLKGENETVTLDGAQIGLFCEREKAKTCLLILPITDRKMVIKHISVVYCAYVTGSYAARCIFHISWGVSKTSAD